MEENEIKQRILATPAAYQWQKIGIKNHHGICLPLFSLHSHTSCGIGEYPDLIPMLSWCHEIGFDIIQLLPLYDTGLETSPYNALTAFGLNPIHLGLSQLPFVENNPSLLQQIAELQKLNSSQRVNYAEVQVGKDRFLRNYYATYGHSITSQEAYHDFKFKHSWLAGYSLFKAIKIRQEWQSWELWPPLYKDPTDSFILHPPSDLKQEADFHTFVQYLCSIQLEKVKEHATKLGIFIKGDIPILISKESAGVWNRRQLFLLQLVAGAPPDMYSEEGQKWGFPLYNWDAIAAQNFRFWSDRLNVASQFFHIYRIDHIVGFFRIWAIPTTRPAKEGHFIPEDKAEWIPHGESIMRILLASCHMLPIGEDLGVIPLEVRTCLRSLGISGTKVMRWERNYETDRLYINPKDYPPESMTTVSTHDSETLQLWWENQKDEAKIYAEMQGWTYTPELTYEQRFEILRASHHSGSLFHINLLQEYLALIPEMVWPNPEDERINVPGVVSDLNWTYRFRPSIEEITANDSLKQIMAEILAK